MAKRYEGIVAKLAEQEKKKQEAEAGKGGGSDSLVARLVEQEKQRQEQERKRQEQERERQRKQQEAIWRGMDLARAASYGNIQFQRKNALTDDQLMKQAQDTKAFYSQMNQAGAKLGSQAMLDRSIHGYQGANDRLLGAIRPMEPEPAAVPDAGKAKGIAGVGAAIIDYAGILKNTTADIAAGKQQKTAGADSLPGAVAGVGKAAANAADRAKQIAHETVEAARADKNRKTYPVSSKLEELSKANGERQEQSYRNYQLAVAAENEAEAGRWWSEYEKESGALQTAAEEAKAEFDWKLQTGMHMLPKGWKAKTNQEKADYWQQRYNEGVDAYKVGMMTGDQELMDRAEAYTNWAYSKWESANASYVGEKDGPSAEYALRYTRQELESKKAEAEAAVAARKEAMEDADKVYENYVLGVYKPQNPTEDPEAAYYQAKQSYENAQAEVEVWKKAIELDKGDEFAELEERIPDEAKNNPDTQNRISQGEAYFREDKAVERAGGSSSGNYVQAYEDTWKDVYNLTADWERESGYGMTEAQKDTFFYIYAEDPQLAEEFAKACKKKAEESYYAEKSKPEKNWLKRIGKEVLAANMKLLGGAVPFTKAGQKLTKEANAMVSSVATGREEYGAFNSGLLTGKLPESVPIIGGKGLGDLTQLNSSMIMSGETQAAAKVAMATGHPGAAAVIEVVGLYLQSGAAANEDYIEMRELGWDDGSAMFHAACAGISEAAFEKLSLDHFVKAGPPKNWRDTVKMLFTQAGVEASEETFTTIANRITDTAIAKWSGDGYDDDRTRRAKEYMAAGMSYQQAYEKADRDMQADLFNDALGGFLSGLLMSGGETALSSGHQGFQRIKSRRAGLQMGNVLSTENLQQYISEYAQKENQLRDAGQTFDAKDVKAYRQGLETSLVNRGVDWNGNREESDVQVGDTPLIRQPAGLTPSLQGEGMGGEVAAAQTEQQSPVRQEAREAGIQEGSDLQPTELRNMIEQLTTTEMEVRESGEMEAAERITGYREGLEQALRQQAVDWNGNRAQNDGQALLVPTDINGQQVAGTTEKGRQIAGATENGQQVAGATENGRQVAGATENSQQVAGTTENGRQVTGPTEQNGGLNDGRIQGRSEIGGDSGQIARAADDGQLSARAAGLADSGQRDAGLGTDRQAGGLGEGTGRSVTRSTRAQELAQLKNYVQALGAEKQSAREIGIRDGTKNAANLLIADEGLTDSMQQIRSEAESAGLRVDFVLGKMETRNRSGGVTKSSGVFQFDRDGTPHVYLQADSRAYSPQQLFEHELFHSIVAANKGLWTDIVDHLYQTHTKEEIVRMVDAYVQAYDGCYGIEEADAEKYLEEIFADVYAEIQRGGGQQRAARELAGETAQRFAGDIENARQNLAGIENRNGPGTRLSVDDSDRQFLNDTEMYSTIAFLVDEMIQEGKFVSVSSEEILKMKEQYDWSDEDKAREAIKQILSSVAGVRVRFSMNGKTVTAYLTRDGLKHAGGNNNTPEKAATYSKFLELVDKSEYAGSQYDKRLIKISEEEAKKPEADRIDKFTSAAVVDGKVYAIVFVTKDVALDTEHHIYAPYMYEETSVSNNGISQQNAGNAQPIYGASKVSGESIAEGKPGVKGNSEESVDWNGNWEEPETRRSAAEAEDDSLSGDWFGNREEDGEQSKTPAVTETDAPHPSPAATPSTPQGAGPEGEGSGGQVARATEDGGQVARATDEAQALAREKKLVKAERSSVDSLKGQIKSAEERLRALKALKDTGLMARDERSQAEWKRRIADVEETLEISRQALKTKQEAKKAELADKTKQEEKRQQRKLEKAAAKKEAELAKDKPRQARKEFRQDALNLFSVQPGKRQTLGNIINDFADRMIEQGSVSEADRRDLFRQLYEAGVEFGAADPYYQEIRSHVEKGRIYVPENVRAEFGDDWTAFRNKAWGNRIYLTNDSNDMGVDSWNAELAEAFPGSFDEGETDARRMLENLVDLAEEGKGERLTLAEMMQRNQKESGVTVDEQMDELERKVDRLIDTFAQKAELEQKIKTAAVMQQVQERRRNRESVERQRQRRQELETRRKVMDQVQKLQKLRKRVKPDFQGKIDEILGRLDPNGEVGVKGYFGVIDTVARSISPEGLEDLPALAREYNAYKKAKGEDFIPLASVEKRINRLSEIQLDSLTLDDVITLGEAVSALATQIQNENRLLADERDRKISDSAMAVNTQIENAKGTADNGFAQFLEKLFSLEALDMPRLIEHLTGYERGGEGERFAKSLMKATTDEAAYIAGADKLFKPFKADEKNLEWMKKATGNHAELIEIQVPVEIGTDDSETPVTKLQSFRITPMMRVSLLMHSRNYENLRHIEETGIKIPKEKWVRDGNMKKALAGAPVVRMAPSTVKAIVSKCTPQERAFAECLKKYFDEFSKQRINDTSLVLDGFYRANVEHYFPIESDKAFLGGSNGAIGYDRSLTSNAYGSLQERQHGVNPIVLGDAADIYSRHVATFSRYCAFAIPMRDFNEVFSFVFHEDGKPFAGSVMNTLEEKFGENGSNAIRMIQSALAQNDPRSDKVYAKTVRKIRGRVASASLSGNFRVMASQFASLGYALPYIDGVDLMASFKDQVDTEIRDIYSPISQYRRGGYINQEIGDIKSDLGYMSSLPAVGTGITDVDTFTINRLWAAAVHMVQRTTDLKPGSREEVLAGTDPFYLKVAEIYTEAVYKTQPNYSTALRPAILRDSDELIRSMFMFKTVPLQVYGMLYEAAGRRANDRARWENDKSAKNKKNYKASQKFFWKTQAGVLIGSLMYVGIRGIFGGVVFREKKYRDEDGRLTWKSMLKALGGDLLDTYAGSFIGASELLAVGRKAFGKSNYNNKIFNNISSLGEVEDGVNAALDIINSITDKDWQEGKRAIHEAAEEISVLGFGFPTRNIEKFLLSATKWIAPEWADRYENFFDEYEREDLDQDGKRFLTASVRVLMDNRTDGLSDDTIEELSRLWENGQTIHIPSGIPTSIKVGEEEKKVTASLREDYRDAWNKVVSKTLEKVIASESYQAADDKGKAKMIKKLYDYAAQQAAHQAVNKDVDAWVEFGEACEFAGIPLEDYLAAASITKDSLKELDGSALEDAIRGRMRLRVGELDDNVVEELGRLYEAGETSAIPSDVPTNVSVNGEEINLTPDQRAEWLQTWKQTAAENLASLIGSEAYQKANDALQAAMVNKLYDYAGQLASEEVAGKIPENWVSLGKACEEAGIQVEDYLRLAAVSTDKIKELEGKDLDNAIRDRMQFRVGDLKDNTLKEISRLYAEGATGVIPGKISDGFSVNNEDIKLTPDQRVTWIQAWKKEAAAGLDDLIASKAYVEADDENKVKMLESLYELATEGAKASVLPGYSSKVRWAKAGLAAESQGVPLSEYVAFHNELSDLSKDKDKIQLLKKQEWSDQQKETVWLQAFADETQAKKYENLKKGGASWADAMSVMDIGGDATEGLTEDQLKVYNQKWEEITGETTKNLMKAKAYKDADDEGREVLVDKLNEYASAVARAEATKKPSNEAWINAGIVATKEGVKLEEYIVFTNQLSTIDGKDDKGESVDGLARQRQLALLNSTGWTDKQKEAVFLESSMTDESAATKEKALRSAGLTWDQTSTVMGTLGGNANKARAITATTASEDAKLKALEVYLTEGQYKSAKACRSFDVKLDLWLQGKVNADANGNDRVTQEEAADYVDGLNISWEEKAYLWQLLCPSTKSSKGTYPDTWKKNPFSTTLGRELWRYLYEDEG